MILKWNNSGSGLMINGSRFMINGARFRINYGS